MFRPAALLQMALLIATLFLGCARTEQLGEPVTQRTTDRQRNESIADEDGNALAAFDRGQRALDQNKFHLAINHFSEAIRLNPRDVRFYQSRGFAHDVNGDYQNAIGDFTRALELDPHHAGTYMFRGDAYVENGDYDRAIADLTEAIRLGGSNEDFALAFTYVNRGVAHDEKGEYEEAIADFSEAIWLDPTIVKPYLDRSISYFKNQQYEESIADCTEAIRLEPDDPRGYAYRGRAYRALGDEMSATKDERRARELNK